MRTIKFRAFDKEAKRMLNWETISKIGVGTTFKAFFNHKQLEVMQFTGLLDKNGKEIYEGDIVEHKGKYYWVEWKDYKWKLWRSIDGNIKGGGHPFRQIFTHPDNFEVWGNIYQNPIPTNELNN